MEIRQGIDMTSVRRIQKAIQRRGRFFLNRVFTLSEQAYCGSKRMKYEHYAARFAAKEAAIKAFKIKKCVGLAGFAGLAGLAMRDIEIRRKPTGRPFIYLAQKVRKRFQIPGNCRIELSMTHEREYAIATVLLVLP